VVVEQVIRPTGLLDPIIEVRPTGDQIENLLEEIDIRIKQGDRVLITTLTKRMAEELTKFMERLNLKVKYIHSEVKTLDRVEILRELRLGIIDVLVGVNLLREGLDLPEVSLVAIMDADKEGFLRDQRSMIQTIGRAARNENGMVIMYADRMTGSMEQAIEETRRRRAKQEIYNTEHGITPKTIRKSAEAIMQQTKVADSRKDAKVYAFDDMEDNLMIAADPVVAYMPKQDLEKLATKTQKDMERAAKELDFITAARLRDELAQLKELLKQKG
jgi:excinuclease ABC subunit B